MRLYFAVKKLTDAYVRKGGERSRKDRRKIMLKFAQFAQGKGVISVEQLGKRHVILYWKANTRLKSATLNTHWYALCDLWKLIGKGDKPPKFKLAEKLKVVDDVAAKVSLGTDEVINEILGYDLNDDDLELTKLIY